jgi:hypothetical protein
MQRKNSSGARCSCGLFTQAKAQQVPIHARTSSDGVENSAAAKDRDEAMIN